MVINMSGDDVVCSDDGQWRGLSSVRPPLNSLEELEQNRTLFKRI